MPGIARPRNPGLSDRPSTQSRWSALAPRTEDPPSRRERVDALLYSLSLLFDEATEGPTAALVAATAAANEYAYLVATEGSSLLRPCPRLCWTTPEADLELSEPVQPSFQKTLQFWSKPGIARPPDPDVAADLPLSQTLWSELPLETSNPPSELNNARATAYYQSFATVAADGFRTREIEDALLSADLYMRRITAAMYPGPSGLPLASGEHS